MSYAGSAQCLIPLDALSSDQDTTRTILLIIFHPIFFTRRGDFAMDIDGNHSHSCGQFQWSQSYCIKLRCEVWMSFPPTLFAIPEYLRLLALWNIWTQNKEWTISDSWRSWQRSGKTRYSKTSSPSSSIELNVLNRLLSMGENTALSDIKIWSESLSHGKVMGRELFIYLISVFCTISLRSFIN
jgi:hypothetical protein